MIIRKPYAFMIKHFKLIHLILLVLLGFIYSNIHSINSLFTRMVTTNTTIYTGAAGYINKTINLFIFLVLGLSLLVHMLLKSKKKKTWIYIGTVLYMVILMIGFAYLNGRLKFVADNALEIDKISLLKDLSFILGAPCYPLFVLFLIRGLGWNISQFNFNQDIKGLELSEEDSEEIELTLSNNTYKYFRFLRRFAREMKYYILEHTFIFSGIVFLSIVSLAGVGINFYRENLKANAINVVSMVDGVNYSVSKAYVTTRDFNGNTIKKGSKFIVLELGLRNVNYMDKVIDLDRLSISDNNISYYPTVTYNNRFFDLGVPYEKNNYIAANDMVFRLFVFEIPEKARVNNFVLKIYGGYDVTKKFAPIYKRFNITPRNLDTPQTEKIYRVGDKIESNVIDLNKFDITIASYEFTDTYKYQYVSCKSEDNCRTLSQVIKPQYTNISTLLVLDYKADLDEKALFYYKFNNMRKIIENFVQIEYSTAAKFVENKVNFASDYNVSGKIILEVNREILKANHVNLYFNYRDKKAKLSLKGSPEVKLIEGGEAKTYEDLHISNVQGLEKKEEPKKEVEATEETTTVATE